MITTLKSSKIILTLLFVVLAIVLVSKRSSPQQQSHPLMDEGLRLEKEGKLEQALEIYQKVALEVPKFADVYARMGYTLRKMGYGKKASEMFSKCKQVGGFKQSSPYAMDAKFVGGWWMTDSMVVKAASNEQELLEKESPAKALMYSSGDMWVLLMTGPEDSVPIIKNSPTIGIGSELRFDQGDWVEFLGKQYRKGGVRVMKTGLQFLEGTEQLYGGKVSVLRGGNWVRQ